MGINIMDWIARKFATEKPMRARKEINEADYREIVGELQLKELVFWTCINKIANIISKCEVKTYIDGKETKGEEWYLWNMEPNKNQNSAEFWIELIGKLYRRNEALAVEKPGIGLIIADSFSKTENAFGEDTFTQITVKGKDINKDYRQSEVLHWKLNNVQMERLVNGIYESYQEVLSFAMNTYKKSKGEKGILYVDSKLQGNDDFEETFDQIMNEYFKKYFNATNAVLPLFDGYKYESTGNKTYNTETSRDIKNLTDDIYDITARAINMPPSIAKGDVQDTTKAVEEFLTFCINPLAALLGKEITRKRCGKRAIQQNEYIEISTKNIKHWDLFDIGNPIDKLISSGAFCVNEIRIFAGEPIIDEPWAWKHIITKNYSSIEELLNTISKQEGGEENAG